MNKAWADLCEKERRWKKKNPRIVEKWKHLTFKSDRAYSLSDDLDKKLNIFKQVVALKGLRFARNNHPELYTTAKKCGII